MGRRELGLHETANEAGIYAACRCFRNRHLSVFGKERLLMLESATKGSTSDDPIGDFLKAHDLYFDPEAEIDLDAYQRGG